MKKSALRLQTTEVGAGVVDFSTKLSKHEDDAAKLARVILSAKWLHLLHKEGSCYGWCYCGMVVMAAMERNEDDAGAEDLLLAGGRR